VWRTLNRILYLAAVMKNTRSQPGDIHAADAEVLPAVAGREQAFREVMLSTSGRSIVRRAGCCSPAYP
jgi:hypothetical protein